jgi:ParB-like chromosome segregation protein Spo0J
MSATRDERERMVAPGELGELLGALRLRNPDAVRSLRHSLVRHGQLTAAAAYRDARGGLELLDGFKRLHASRELGWDTLRVRVLELDAVQAKAAVVALHQPGGLTELEEGWLVRSLYRDDALTQPQIGQLLDRHKSWVCRRLMLVERLDDAVQGDVRLGLLAPRTAVELCRLPHGNQSAAAALVARRGLTTLQTQQLVAVLLAATDEAERRRILDDWAQGRPGPTPDGGGARTPRPPSSPALMIVSDVGQLCRVAARLEARLLERSLTSLGADGQAVVMGALAQLRPVLTLLLRALEQGPNPTQEAR